MRNLLILAAAASLAVGCHNRSEDEVGAAPARGDTTAVASDTTKAMPTDTTMGHAQAPTSADTSTMRSPPVTPDSAMTNQSAPNTTDSTSTKAWPDSTAAQPTDSTAPAKQ